MVSEKLAMARSPGGPCGILAVYPSLKAHRQRGSDPAPRSC